MHVSSYILRAAWTCKNTLGALRVLYLFVYLLSQWGSNKQWAPGVWQRQTCWLLGYWETPPALISEEEREMKRKPEGGREEKRKVWLSDRRRERGKRREKKKQKGRWMDHGFHPFRLVSLQGKHTARFSSLSLSRCCHPLVISQHKILRISPGHRGCSLMLLNQQHSRLNHLINV